MAPSQSNLSAAQYGYDFVVGVTQASINATMLAYIASLQEPIINVCYIADSEGKPQQIDYEELKNRAGGTDPFSVPDAVSPTDPALTQLLQARFIVGFRAQIGIPPMDDPKSLPDMVTLGSDTTAVDFGMYCSEFTVAYLNPGGGYASVPSFMKKTQPKNNPWVFRSRVNLNLSTVANDGYANLPPVVQAQIKNMSGSAFSIQQLLFDLSSAALSSIPTIDNMNPGSLLYMIMQQYFIGAYFTELKKNGQPLLGCSVVHHDASVATMTVTNLNMEACPYVDSTGQPCTKPNPTQQSLATLNYLCAADGASLPPPVPLNWNWVEPADMADHDGILSINRNTFANYFRHKLAQYVPTVCIQPYAHVEADGLGSDMSCSFTPGQAPTVTCPGGSTVLKYDYSQSSYDEAGLNGDLGHLQLNSTFNLAVEFKSNTVVITQQLTIYCGIKKNFTSESGNVFDKTIVDTYTIAIADDGSLQATLQSVPTDNSCSLSTDAFQNFFTNMNDVSRQIKDAASSVAGSNFTDIPISTLQKYVFPGGKTFAFKDVQFSDNQDLYAAITYVDPTGPVHTVPS